MTTTSVAASAASVSPSSMPLSSIASLLPHRRHMLLVTTILLLTLLTILTSPLLTVVHAQIPPPYPTNTSYGLPSSLVWGPGTTTNAGTNPLNKAGAAADGSGGIINCQATQWKTNYAFNVLENYQQVITFFPSTCSQLKAIINSITGTGQMFVYSPTTGRGSSISQSQLPYTLPTNMLLYQPIINDFSIFDSPRNPILNSSLTTVVFQVNDGTSNNYPSYTNLDLSGNSVAGAQVNLWVIWQNQPPTSADLNVQINDNSLVTTIALRPQIHDPEVDGDNGKVITQTLSVYIYTLPTAGFLYQYDGNATGNKFKGAPITLAQTLITDSSNQSRVVFERVNGGYGRPYSTFTYNVDDAIVDSVTPGVVTVDVLLHDTPVPVDSIVVVNMNDQKQFAFQVSSTIATQALNRAILTSMPSQGSLYQVLANGDIGPRIQSVPTNVTDSGRSLYFKPDPYTADAVNYTTFTFAMDNGLDHSVNDGTVLVKVNTIALAPFSQDIFAISTSGNDISIRFIGTTLQPNSTKLTAVITSLPVNGTLRQSDGSRINQTVFDKQYAINNLGLNVTDTQFLTVIYSPLQNVNNPSQNKRYTEEFTYIIRDESSGKTSTPSKVKVQVGSVVKPPLVYDDTYKTQQNATNFIIQLNGTVQDVGDSWTPFITKLPEYGTLYQMNNAQKGAQISGTAATPVADPNFYVFFEPNRFSPPNVTFEFIGQNSEGVQSVNTAVATILIDYVQFTPTVPLTKSITTPSSTPAVFQCEFFAGPTPPSTIEIFIIQAPTAGNFYQYNSTTQVRGKEITAAMIATEKAAGSPGVLVTDSEYRVLYDPPLYEHGPETQNYAFAQFQYIARDLLLISPTPSSVAIAVTKVNFPPVVSDGNVTTLEEVAITIYLKNYVFNPSAADGNKYICRITTLPPSTKGALYNVDDSGKSSSFPMAYPQQVSDAQTRVIYKPRSGEYGKAYDMFQFQAEDSDHSVKSVRFGTITVDVTFVNKPPKAPSVDAKLQENQGKVIKLPITDPEGNNNTIANITSLALPSGKLFQFVSSGGGLPLNNPNYTNLAVGGAPNDPEYGSNYTYWNFTGTDTGGGFSVEQFLGAPITQAGTIVTDPQNRVVYLPIKYTHGNRAYAELAGTFTYTATDNYGDVSTPPGVISVKVKTVKYAPEAYDAVVNVDEDSWLIIELPITNYDPDDPPNQKIFTLPLDGEIYQYDGRASPIPKGDRILSSGTQVQDMNKDNTVGAGLKLVYEPPKLRYGVGLANFSFYGDNGKRSRVATISINVNKVNHKPTTSSFAVSLSGHNSTVPVSFNITDVDSDEVYIQILTFPKKGQLWKHSTYIPDPTPSGFSTYSPVPGTMLVPATADLPGTDLYYPDDYNQASHIRTTNQVITILFDDFNMGGGAVATGCTREGTSVPCGYTNFTFRVLDTNGTYSDGFVEVQIQCGPSYVINTWQTNGPACIQCPIGAICASEGQFLPRAERGYWRGITDSGLMFVGCLPPSACLGTNSSAAVDDLDSQCAEGYHGRMCAACASTHYKLNDSCESCSNTSVFWIVLVGVPIALVMMWFILHVSRRGVDLTFFAIVLTYCQILAIYAQYHLTWPQSILTTLTVFSITHLNLDIFAVSCFYNTGDYSDKWVAKMAVIPGLLGAVIAMVIALIVMRSTCSNTLNKCDLEQKRKRKLQELEEEKNDLYSSGLLKPKPQLQRGDTNGSQASEAQAAQDKYNQEHRDSIDALTALHTKAYLNNDPSSGFDENTPLPTWINYYISLGVRTFTLLIFVAYLPICSKVFQLFNCTSFPDGTSTFDADWSLICYDPWWKKLRPWGAICIILYGFGIPAWFAFGLYKTAPKFDWVCWWGFIYFPKVRKDDEKNIAMRKLQSGVDPENSHGSKSGKSNRSRNGFHSKNSRNGGGRGNNDNIVSRVGPHSSKNGQGGSRNNQAQPAPTSRNSRPGAPPPPPANPPSIPAPDDNNGIEMVSNPMQHSNGGVRSPSAAGTRQSSRLNSRRNSFNKDDDTLGTHTPHLHAATVQALEQARAGTSAEDVQARNKTKEDEEAAALKAKREQAWHTSENLALTSADNKKLTQEEKIARFMFTLVIDPFRDDLFFWMFMILIRSFLLAMVSIFFADEPVYQATLALLVLFLYTLATAYFQPYVNPAMNKLEFITMSCACLVLFSGFLFVGESNKSDAIFSILAAACLCVIIVSFIFIGRVVFAKLEEVFHCWNCRRVPTVNPPALSVINAIGQAIRNEVMNSHDASVGRRNFAHSIADSQGSEKNGQQHQRNATATTHNGRAGHHYGPSSASLLNPSGSSPSPAPVLFQPAFGGGASTQMAGRHSTQPSMSVSSGSSNGIVVTAANNVQNIEVPTTMGSAISSPIASPSLVLSPSNAATSPSPQPTAASPSSPSSATGSSSSAPAIPPRTTSWSRGPRASVMKHRAVVHSSTDEEKHVVQAVINTAETPE